MPFLSTSLALKQLSGLSVSACSADDRRKRRKSMSRMTSVGLTEGGVCLRERQKRWSWEKE